MKISLIFGENSTKCMQNIAKMRDIGVIYRF